MKVVNMSGVEFIGFVVSVVSLIFIYYKNQREMREREAHPEKFQDEPLEEDPLKALMSAMQKEQLKREKEQRERMQGVERALPKPKPKPKAQPLPPPAPQTMRQSQRRSPLEEYRLASEVETRRLKSALEERQLKSKLSYRHEHLPAHVPAQALHLHMGDPQVDVQPSRAQQAIRRLAHLPDLVIYQEILSPPKSLRPDP
jgi:hypothetical protein